MQGLASNLGCGSGDTACLCRNPDFTYGIRDCSYQSCNDNAQAEQAVAYGINLCRDAGVAVATTPQATVTQATGTATVSASPVVSSIFSVITSDGNAVTTLIGETTIIPGSVGETATPSAVATSTFTTLITSGESVLTSVVETTLSGVGGVPGATSLPQTPIATEPVVGTATSSGSLVTSIVGSTTFLASMTGSEASSVLSSEASETPSATASEQESQTATGEATSASTSGLVSFAPKQTAGSAAGFLAVAGLAAMLI
ncbi:CFEM domain-containing protein [Colletotrichum plurivorum]|uniref:CFEM domain-containing protein n=1 Tax=Colletotrichum plurivorum TaxID=2175906 RepID=A0A8H6U430_9PEZI|nr:CFEM domain-containing protein [Colletotrichum plurivorum]